MALQQPEKEHSVSHPILLQGSYHKGHHSSDSSKSKTRHLRIGHRMYAPVAVPNMEESRTCWPTKPPDPLSPEQLCLAEASLTPTQLKTGAASELATRVRMTAGLLEPETKGAGIQAQTKSTTSFCYLQWKQPFTPQKTRKLQHHRQGGWKLPP